MTDEWTITNSREQIVRDDTQKGFAIIAACEMCFAQIEAGEMAE